MGVARFPDIKVYILNWGGGSGGGGGGGGGNNTKKPSSFYGFGPRLKNSTNHGLKFYPLFWFAHFCSSVCFYNFGKQNYLMMQAGVLENISVGKYSCWKSCFDVFEQPLPGQKVHCTSSSSSGNSDNNPFF